MLWEDSAYILWHASSCPRSEVTEDKTNKQGWCCLVYSTNIPGTTSRWGTFVVGLKRIGFVTFYNLANNLRLSYLDDGCMSSTILFKRNKTCSHVFKNVCSSFVLGTDSKEATNVKLVLGKHWDFEVCVCTLKSKCTSEKYNESHWSCITPSCCENQRKHFVPHFIRWNRNNFF